MKKTILLCLTLCIGLLAYAQATDLVVDCQNPGWLSSKINYVDQQTVKNLKVTGYINKEDLKFIGQLIEQEQLDGYLDLSEVYLVGNKMEDNSFALNTNSSLRRFDLPRSVTEYSNIFFINRGEGRTVLTVDTLVFEPENLNYVSGAFFERVQFGKAIKNLVVGENVDSIPAQYDGFWEYEKIQSIFFKGKIRYLGNYAFAATPSLVKMNVEAFDSLEFIGENVFRGGSWRLDTLYQPKKIVYFPVHSFPLNDYAHVFFGTTLKRLNGTNYLQPLHFHFVTMTPPECNFIMSNKMTIYIPKGAKDAYLSNEHFKEATIIEDNPVTGINLNEHEIFMNIGEKYSISVVISPLDADDQRISWTSNDTTIATVDQNGLITAIASGETKVYVTSIATGIKDSCSVVVRKNVESVSFRESQISLDKIGDTKQLEIIISPEDATDKSVVWKSHNESICTVTDNGLVTAIGIGSTAVTVTTVDGGLTATCAVKVVQHVSNLALDKNILSIKVGETDQLHATISPENADNKGVLWSSSDESKLTVTQNGTINALKPGEVWVKAISDDNPEAKDSCKVTVTQPVTGVTISQSSCGLTNIGESFQLEATVLPEDASNKEVKWTSSNEGVCMVANGKVIATGYGTAVVFVTTTDGGFVASCTVIVEKETIPVTSIELSQTTATLEIGDTLRLTATVMPIDATNKNVIWKSSNDNICTITQTGLATAVGEGKATITVIPENGVGQAQCEVTVNQKSDGIISVISDGKIMDADIYDMMGHKVNRMIKGHLYIRNGRKFVAR